jgi:CDP-glucose 4,6-dehydratase
LIPDIFRAQSSGDTLFIRSPNAVRPWQHVLEPVSAYLRLAQALYESPRTFSEGWNIGPDSDENYAVSYIVNAINERLPFSFEFGSESGTGAEATILRLDSTKIRNALDWHSKFGIDDALKATIDWQEALGHNAQMLDVTLEQINSFTA